MTDLAFLGMQSASTEAPASTMLYGLIDDEVNFEDFASEAEDTTANAARIIIGYNTPGSAGSLAAVEACQSRGMEVIVCLFTVDVQAPSVWATQTALVLSTWPDVYVECMNEPNFWGFGGYTPAQAAAGMQAAVDACGPDKVIGCAIGIPGEMSGGDYFQYQLEMYYNLGLSGGLGDLKGVATHCYPTSGDPAAEMEEFVTEAAVWGKPVYFTELGFQYGIYGAYQPAVSVNAFNAYYNDPRVGGLFYYRLAPQQPTPNPGETFQRYPLTTNPELKAALTDAFSTPP